MKIFTIGFSYTVVGTALHIEAETPEEAQQWLFDEINQNGIEEFEYNTIERDFHVETAKESED